MGIWDTLLGNSAADASRKAAADTYAKQTAATGELKGFGDQYAQSFAGLGKGYQPFVDTGYSANSAVQNLINDPSSVRSLPGYQFQLEQGTRAIDHSAASKGNLFSGATGKALQSYGQNLADTTYGSQLQRLLGVSGQGQQALGQQNAAIGTGLQGQLATRQSAYGGDMNAAGTIGQGDIAAANAQAKGLQGLLGTAASLGGMALGGGGLSSFGGGLSSLMGGTPDYGQTTNNKFGNYSFPTFGRG